MAQEINVVELTLKERVEALERSIAQLSQSISIMEAKHQRHAHVDNKLAYYDQ
jgi:hypothetical protein